jgi:hypothetical protein
MDVLDGYGEGLWLSRGRSVAPSPSGLGWGDSVCESKQRLHWSTTAVEGEAKGHRIPQNAEDDAVTRLHEHR